MPISLSELFYGCGLPAILSLVTWLLLSKVVHDKKFAWGNNWVVPLSLSVGFVVGYALLGLAPWKVTSHWHTWIYTLLWVALIGPAIELLPRNIVVRWLATALLFTPVGIILTPAWDLDFSKWLYIPLIVVLMSGWTLSMQHGSYRVAESTIPSGIPEAIVLCISLFVLVVVTFLSGSLRFTQLAMIGASCFAGLVWFRSFREQLRHALSWAAAVIVGMLFIAQVNSYSSVPSVAYLLAALAPICGDSIAQFSSAETRAKIFVACSSALLLVALVWATVVEIVANLGNEY